MLFNKEKEIYNFWDVSIPEIPSRSRLYDLDPIGIGTPFVESLTSYMYRLADAHNVNLYKLIQKEIGRYFNKLYLQGHASERGCGSIQKYINSSGPVALEFVQALEDLTLRKDLMYLTILSWTGVLNKGLIRQYKAWCPLCFEEWKVNNKPIYEPLYWSLGNIHLCLVHEIPLKEECPYCKKKLLYLHNYLRLGFCYSCNSWLGDEIHADFPSCSILNFEWEKFVTESMSKLLEMAFYLNKMPTKYKVKSALNNFMKSRSLKLTEFSNLLNLNASTVCCWTKGTHIPSIEYLLKICQLSNVSLYSMFAEENPFVNEDLFSLILENNDSKRLISNRTFDYEKVKSELEAVIISNEAPPPSMAQVAKNISCSLSTVKRHFPEYCKEISTRYLRYRTEEKERRIDEICKEVEMLTKKLHAEGIYPSRRSLRKRLVNPNIMFKKEARETWKKTLRSLGIL
jgi:transcriptional regulator with XRE-family HTH domain